MTQLAVRLGSGSSLDCFSVVVFQGPPGPIGIQGPVGQSGPPVCGGATTQHSSSHENIPCVYKPTSVVISGCGRRARSSWTAGHDGTQRRRRTPRVQGCFRTSGTSGQKPVPHRLLPRFPPSVHVVRLCLCYQGMPGTAGEKGDGGHVGSIVSTVQLPCHSARVHLATGDQRLSQVCPSHHFPALLLCLQLVFCSLTEMPHDFAQFPNLSGQELKPFSPSYFNSECHFLQNEASK